MKYKKVLQGLILALPILFVGACSYKKGNEKTDTENTLTDSSNTSTSLPTEQVDRQQIQIQELQSNNNNIVYFGFDKYDLTPEYTQILNQHAAFLRMNPLVQITIEGHTDKRGTPEYNIALGERRAKAVKIYLQSKGVNSEQMTIVSYGKEKLALDGNSEQTHAKNRRAILAY